MEKSVERWSYGSRTRSTATFAQVLQAIGCALFFLMLFAPRTYLWPKVALLTPVCLTVLIQLIGNISGRLHKKTFLWLLVCFLHGGIWCIIGLANENPGAVDYLRLNVLWVLLYGVFILSINSELVFKKLLKTITFGSTAVALFSIATVADALGMLPLGFLSELDLGATVGIHSGHFQLTAHNVGTFTFTGPFLYSLILVGDTEARTGIKKRTAAIAFLIAIAGILLSGRRGIWLNLAITPFVVLLLSLACSKEASRGIRKRFFYFAALPLIVISTVFIADMTASNWSWKNINEATLQRGEDELRYDQFSALMNGFKENPILGTGFGEGTPDVVRSEEAPWRYELSYVLLLFNTGVLGTLIYAVLIGSILWGIVSYIRRTQSGYAVGIPIATGMIGMIVANATNPYLGSFDYLWTIYFPVAFLNLAWLQKLTDSPQGLSGADISPIPKPFENRTGN